MKVPTRRWWYGMGLGLLGAFVGIQLVPYGHNQVNPPTVTEPTWHSPAAEELLEGDMPPAMYRLNAGACALEVQWRTCA